MIHEAVLLVGLWRSLDHSSGLNEHRGQPHGQVLSQYASVLVVRPLPCHMIEEELQLTENELFRHH